ncbi:uncharacterized protein LOC110924357 [Helianthus annuus]|uniref:uncharacterized protein LOC110924357 n=1 Tax=Helianthus annuus TaxID=4232 RepID=UPI000B8FF61C|nr:uncharacterized protein LOC110924357 [Helianthus annuus]
MGDKNPEAGSSKPPTSTLYPVYTVTNVQNKVRVLDGKKVTYSSWVKLFQLHARGYKVLDHIDGTLPPAKDDQLYESWMEIDAIELQWIYSTLSDDLVVRVLDIVDYCQKLRELASQLADVDQPVTEGRLIIQLVNGLPPEYDVVAAAQLHHTLPPWEDAVNLLDAEERRHNARMTPPVVAAATRDTDQP